MTESAPRQRTVDQYTGTVGCPHCQQLETESADLWATLRATVEYLEAENRELRKECDDLLQQLSWVTGTS